MIPGKASNPLAASWEISINPRLTHRGTRADHFLSATVDICILASIFIIPLLFGGWHPLGQLLLIVLSAGGAAAWTLQRSLARQATWRMTRIEPLLLAATAFLVFQITLLPESLLAHLQGGAAETLRLIAAQDDGALLGDWTRLSLAPAAMAAFGLLQFLTANGKYFWFFEHHLGDTAGAACGSFLNRNHFAHFLALGIGPIVWWTLQATQTEGLLKTCDSAGLSSSVRTQNGGSGNAENAVGQANRGARAVLLWSAVALVLLAVLSSLSRGGAAASLVALSVILFFAYRNNALRGLAIAAVAGTSLAVVLLLGILGHERVAGRLDDWFSGSLENLDRDADRRTVWRATAAAASENVLFGVGAGGHQHVCPMYLDASGSPANVESAGRYFSAHADNSPLEIFEETGLIGIALLAVAAVTASLVASAFHNLVDCGWHVPGCMTLTAVLLAASCRLFQLSAGEERRRCQRILAPRAFAVVCTLLLVALGAWMLHSRLGAVAAEPYWNEYRLLCRSSIARDSASIVPGVNNAEALQKIIDALENVAAWNPRRVDARTQLAGMYLLLFEHLQSESQLNRMPLTAVRDAAVGFSSPAEIEEWLARAVGPHYRLLNKAQIHAQAATSLCPLEGAAYVYLGELCFLDGGDCRAASRTYLSLATAVCPFDGAILLAAGNEAVLSGDVEQALKFWQHSYRAGRVHQRELVRRLAGHVCPQDPPAEIDFFLDNFQPELPILRQMEKVYAATP